MKKNIIALAITAAVAAPIANAAPTVYGIANFAVQNNGGGDNANGANTGMTVDSIASRMGIKGSEDLGAGLTAVYKFEFGVNPDVNNETTEKDDGTYKTKGNISARNQYVGLAGGFGTVLMGRHDTPVKMSQPTDLFNDGSLDNRAMTNIGFLNSKGGEDRIANVAAYVSPSFGGVTLVGALVPAEALGEDSALTNIYSVAAMYGSKKKGLYLAAAINAADEDSGDQMFTRISAQYKEAGLVANAMYQMSDADGAEGNNITLSAGYKMGKMMPKLKYAMNTEDKSSGKEGTVLGLGLDYALGKKTKAYIEVGMFDEDLAGNEYTSTSVGLQHKF